MRAWLLLTLLVFATTTRAEQIDVDSLLDRVGGWLAAYESALSTLVADEELTQQFTPSTRALIARTRTLSSSYSFIRLPGNRAWLGLREVQRINRGRIRENGPTLREVLATPASSLEVVAAELAWRNARHNLGAPRTINVPTLPLELMDPRHRPRFSFTASGAERIRGIDTSRIAFTEQVRPSLVRSPDGTEGLPTRGRMWIVAATGEILKGEVEAYQEGLDVREWKLTVDFAFNRDLKLLVPTTVREEFAMANGKGTGRATYRNFRRFTTSARIVP